MERIGFIGLGRMGQAMAQRLLDAGFPLIVFNRTQAKAAALLDQGATWAASPAELAQQSDIILSILTDDTAVEQIFTGPQGLLSADLSGKLLVEMSTIRTATIQALRPQVEARGGHLLDAPVSGTLEPARQGQLLTMVGGSESDLERARPVLTHLSRRIAYCGPSGSGTTMKLALNMPMAIFWVGLAEAMAMGKQHGLTPELMLDLYLDSPVALPALRGKAPIMLGAEHEVAFDVTGVRKDLLAMTATAHNVGVPTPTGTAALAIFAAATAAGYGNQDLALLINYVFEMVEKSYGTAP